MNAPAIVGLAIMLASEAATLAGSRLVGTWNTPICWTGFILFADSIVYRARGNSWIRSAPREFLFLALVSIPLWLVFEFYNLFIRNWRYVGLPENLLLRYFGYAWAFATIWPAIFEGAELIGVWRGRRVRLPSTSLRPRKPDTTGAPAAMLARGNKNPRASISESSRWGWGPSASAKKLAVLSIVFGAVMLTWPLLWPSPYLAAPVWLGFIFLLDPIDARLGAESLGRDLAAGRTDRLWNLMFSGLLCGVLWELWNYWSVAKWHYTVPIMEGFKIFEMPLPGYLGFPAFALECFTMYVFVRAIFARNLGPSILRQAQDRRTIGV